MRRVLGFVLALFLSLSLPSGIWAQTGSDVPQGVDEIPTYRGLYVENAPRFLAGAFLAALLAQPEDVRSFLANVKLCASDPAVQRRLRAEGLSASSVSPREAAIALQRGACEIYVSRRFDFAILNQRFDDTAPSDDADTPPQGNDRDQTDDVPRDDVPVDRTPPVIVPTLSVFSGASRTIEVRARITDPESRIRSAFVIIPDGTRTAMTPTGDTTVYVAQVRRPLTYTDETIEIVATNTAGRSAQVRVGLRLEPWCGPRLRPPPETVAAVQDGLSCVGASPGTSDGVLGPNTCGGIAAFLGQRMEGFNAGRIAWSDLRDDVARACEAIQPVELAVPPLVERDSDDVGLSIGLAQAGATRSIRITAPDGSARRFDWEGRPERLTLPMPRPGSEAVYTVEALGNSDEVLDREAMRLVRPAVAMTVRPSGTVSVDEGQATFRVSIDRGGSAISRIEAQPPQTASIAQPYTGNPIALPVPTPDPGTAFSVAIVAYDRDGIALAEETVTLTRPAAVLPPRVTLTSPDGLVLDTDKARLVVGLENPESVQAVRLLGGPQKVELTRRSSSTGQWETRQSLPAPGQTHVFTAQAIGLSGKVLAQSDVTIERADVQLDVWPTGRFETESEGVIALVSVLTGAAWIESIAVRSRGTAQDVEASEQLAIDKRQVRLPLTMPPEGEERQIEIVAIGQDGLAYAPVEITLARPAAAVPVALNVTSLDGFAVDAASTRIAVEVINPAQADVIVIHDRNNGEIITRAALTGGTWSGEVIMPAPGDDRTLLVEAQDSDGTTLATAQVVLLRPVVSAPLVAVPQWVWIAAIALASLMVGYLAAQFKRKGRDAPGNSVSPQGAVSLHIKAEPDDDPMIELTPTSPPAVVIRIEPDENPFMVVETQAEPEEVK